MRSGGRWPSWPTAYDETSYARGAGLRRSPFNDTRLLWSCRKTPDLSDWSVIPLGQGRHRLQVRPQGLQLDIVHLSVRLPGHRGEDVGAVLALAVPQGA